MLRWGTAPVLTWAVPALARAAPSQFRVSGVQEGEWAVKLVVTCLTAAVANKRPGCRKCRNGGRGLVIEGHGPILELRERDIGYQACLEDSLVCGA
ncbi:hypothetical protein chiPu_0029536 [Chiloscyllium punctatum]|uniref:Uncharacterized protein n=1 Tax=Chiloscyllium punctatum TaxID=137246 RepID=A0A401TR69_CHIPU|nr:hypothetical protein [Chiloscyllium punctatum]